MCLCVLHGSERARARVGARTTDSPPAILLKLAASAPRVPLLLLLRLVRDRVFIRAASLDEPHALLRLRLCRVRLALEDLRRALLLSLIHL